MLGHGQQFLIFVTTSEQDASCKTFQVSNSRWTWKEVGSNFTASHLVTFKCHSSWSVVVYFFQAHLYHLLASAFTAATQMQQNHHEEIKSHLEQFHLLMCCGRMLSFPAQGHRLMSEGVVLFSAERASVVPKLAARWPGHPYRWPGLAKRQNNSPLHNPLRGRRISTCKMTGTALSKVSPDSAKGSLPKTTDVQRS